MTRSPVYRFRLYVAGGAANAAQAIANLSAICASHLEGHSETEVVDVFQNPKRALADRIFMTPTLIKISPLPVQRIVGTLSDTQTVLLALGLADATA